ncbi:ATP-dependent helicase [Paenibacillus xylaniclasticus]|uniref:ATP-dependent helicase n=1 Tax=Paenibacillus xylaniclasticus TaxID=588083 RepID=UPI000FDC7F9D|nr:MULTISPECIES: ATP-dependent helicase [Paenibacillus]GFN32458.1 DNA helicase [Paenibacillus curdlanolyticus]
MKYPKAKLSDGLSTINLVGDWEEDALFFRELESRGVKLNKGQLELVRHKDGAALANACAGAGKSSSVASRLAYLGSIHKIDMSKVLLITYTKAGAQEMISKASKLGMTDKASLKKITAGTFHSVFLKILRESGETKEILASDKSKQITIKTIFRQLNIPDKRYRAEDVLALISHYKNQMIGLKEYKDAKDFNDEIYRIWLRYEEYKESKMLIDFDDILLKTYNLLKNNLLLLEELRERFEYIMVDEYQDTNKISCEIIEMIAYPKNNILVVGDSDQAIFSFSGAKIENILNFPKRYPNAKIFTLNTNYRSTDTILGLANHSICKNKLRFNKESLASKESEVYPEFIRFTTSDHEADHIVKHIKLMVSSGENKYSDFAILYRNNSNSRAIFEELLLNDIPFTSFNSDEVFYENGTVKSLLAYLRLAINPYDFNAISDMLPTLYIAKDKVKEIGSIQQRNPIARPIEHVLDLISSDYQKRKVLAKLKIIPQIVQYKPIQVLKMLREDYERYLVGEDDNETTSLHREIIRETLDELENSSKRYEDVGEYIRFVDRVIKNAKIQKENKNKNNQDTVKLMTIHKSKGLEFPVVFGITMNEGILPHISALEECSDTECDVNSALEEERRLLYVLITRAESKLYMSYVAEHRGKPMAPSRFILEYL